MLIEGYLETIIRNMDEYYPGEGCCLARLKQLKETILTLPENKFNVMVERLGGFRKVTAVFSLV